MVTPQKARENLKIEDFIKANKAGSERGHGNPDEGQHGWAEGRTSD